MRVIKQSNTNYMPPFSELSEQQFVFMYMMARANAKPGGLNVLGIVEDAKKAYREIRKTNMYT